LKVLKKVTDDRYKPNAMVPRCFIPWGLPMWLRKIGKCQGGNNDKISEPNPIIMMIATALVNELEQLVDLI
jgi:hypothetical protein